MDPSRHLLLCFLIVAFSPPCFGLFDYSSSLLVADDDDNITETTFSVSGGDSSHTLYLKIGESTNQSITADHPLKDGVQFIYQFKVNDDNPTDHTSLVELDPANLSFTAGENSTTMSILCKNAGHVLFTIKYIGNDSTPYNLKDAFLHIQMYHSEGLRIINMIIGWVYFAAWSISFYPQVYLNWSRKSVKGLNFDFLALNVTGFAFYSLFNTSLFFNPTIQSEFHDTNPYDIIPVEVNDVVFALHAVFVTVITIIQCLIYERDGQTMSLFGKLCTSFCWAFVSVCLIITLCNPKILSWLQLMYYFSYVKLGITAVKYIPQAYMNYSRKSTVGWSIGNILLDFTGGSFSLLQLFLIAYNYNDWASVFLNPTKFGLGALSILFDVVFMIQHYGLYRNREDAPKDGYEPLNGEDNGQLYSSTSVAQSKDGESDEDRYP